jgi:hypothetical protein
MRTKRERSDESLCEHQQKVNERMNEKEEKKFPLLKLQKVTPTVQSSV